MTRNTRRRAGFTLVELMVVISIIGILIGMVAVAVSGSRTTAQQKNTDAKLRQLDSKLQKQWAETRRLAQSKPPQAVINFAMVPGDSPTDPIVLARAQVIWSKVQMIREFPMSYAEALNPAGASGIPNLTSADLPPIDAFVKQFSGKTPTRSSPFAQNAACLLVAMQQNRNGTGMNADEELGAGHMVDTDGDGVKEIVDGWGKPVVFFRWSSLNPGVDELMKKRTAPTQPDLDRDTEDTDKRLMHARWNASANGAIFNARIHPIRRPYNSATADSYHSEPVIVSTGKDFQLGLGAFAQITDPAQEQDNRYTFKLN